jgi:hypothetical protein
MSIITLQNVQPGELIKADFVNALIGALQALDSRVTSLESGTAGNRPPILMERSPSGNVEVNSPLTLIGRNFIVPSEGNTVVLGGVPINQFNGGSDEQNLIFTVPNVFGGLPRSVGVKVTNRYGDSNELTVGLLPEVINQGGQTVILPQTAPLGQINIGQQYTLSWLVDSQTVLPVTYAFSLVFTNVVGASVNAWQTASQITPAQPKEIHAGAPFLVTAKVTVPGGATSAQIALKAESLDHAFSRTSDNLDFRVGDTTAVSDPRVLVTLPTLIGPFDGQGQPNAVRKATINGVDGIEVKFGATGSIPIRMHVTSDQSAAGTYHFTATVESPGGLWTPGPVTPATAGLIAPQDRNIDAQIQNTDSGNSSTVKFMVVSAVHGAGSGDFTSFVRFPIRGASF